MKMLVLVMCAALPLAMAQQPADLLGRWRSVETSKGGIGAVYYFQADGTVEFSPGAIVDMPYRVEGDQVIFPPGTTNGPETKFKLNWSSDRTMRQSTQGHVDEYQRQGTAPDPRDPLLGECLGSRERDGRQMPEEMFFYPAGKSLLLILFTTQSGRYSVTKGKLVATFDGRGGLDGTFDLTNGVLPIYRSGGRITRLTRY
jgi:hypothetical protein